MSGYGIDFDIVYGSDNFREKKPERKRKILIRLGVDKVHDAWKGRALRKYPVDIFSEDPA